jgi:hypothetical protein
MPLHRTAAIHGRSSLPSRKYDSGRSAEWRTMPTGIHSTLSKAAPIVVRGPGGWIGDGEGRLGLDCVDGDGAGVFLRQGF